MATYIILSRISPDALKDPKDFKKAASAVSTKIDSDCPGVTWKESYATLGRFDFVDLWTLWRQMTRNRSRKQP